MLKSMAPVESPLQRMLVLENVAVRPAGSVMVTEAELLIHPLSSVTIKEYVAAVRVEMVAVFPLFDQL